MSLLRFGLIGVACLDFPGCIDNPNAVGSISSGGGDNPIVVGGGGNGAAGNANATGGIGNGPGSSGGADAGATAAATCRANGQKILLSKACQSADDCVLIGSRGNVTLPGTVTTGCTTLTIGVNRAEEARFIAFSEPQNCPQPVGCAPGEVKVQTEDGRVVPASAVISVECDVDTCKSYAP